MHRPVSHFASPEARRPASRSFLGDGHFRFLPFFTDSSTLPSPRNSTLPFASWSGETLDYGSRFGCSLSFVDTAIYDPGVCEEKPVHQDPFVHLPGLRGAVLPVAESTMRFTAEVLAERDTRMREMGYAADWRQSDAAITQAWRRLLSHRVGSADLWVFGYGSLMWDPGFNFAEVRRATIEGYQRRFAMRVEIVTGSPDRPGLALTLEREQGQCVGLAFRIPADLVEAETAVLARREFVLFNYSVETMTAMTPQGEIEVQVLAADKHDPRYVGDLALTETAAMIGAAKGVKGENKTYVAKLAQQLRAFDIADDYIDRLATLLDATSQ